MQHDTPPVKVASTDQLGPAAEARPLVERLRERGYAMRSHPVANGTIACTEDAAELVIEAAAEIAELKEAYALLFKDNALLRQVHADFRRECGDTDAILRVLGLDPVNCRTDGGSLKLAMISGALEHRDFMLKREAAQAAAVSERHACSIAVWMTLQDALAPDADDKGLDGWMREAEARVKRRA